MRSILITLIALPSLATALPAHAGEHASCAQDRRAILDLEDRNAWFRENGAEDDRTLRDRRYDLDRNIAESNYRPIRAPGEVERLWRDRQELIEKEGRARILRGYIDVNNAEIGRIRSRMAANRCKAKGPIAPPTPEEPPAPPRPLPWQRDAVPNASDAPPPPESNPGA